MKPTWRDLLLLAILSLALTGGSFTCNYDDDDDDRPPATAPAQTP